MTDDGTPDLPVGAPGETVNGREGAGRAYVFASPDAGPDVVLDVTASPLAFPPSGGTLTLTATVTNHEPTAQPLDLWLEAAGPFTLALTRRLGAGTLPAGAAATRTVRLPVPAAAPDGRYTVSVRVGTYPSVVHDAAAFVVTKGGSPRLTGPAVEDEATEASLFGAVVVEDFSAEDFFAEAASPVTAGSFEAHPNPFARATALRYTLDAATPVRLVVYDVLGREVAVLVDGERAAGHHEAVLDGTSLPAGTYLARLEAGGAVQTRRVTRRR